MSQAVNIGFVAAHKIFTINFALTPFIFSIFQVQGTFLLKGSLFAGVVREEGNICN